MCGCQSLLLRLLSSSRECGGFINRYAIIFIIMLQLPHYISTAVDIILTIILAIHFVTIFSTGTIIMLMPPFPHYTTTGYTIPSNINAAPTFFTCTEISHAPCTDIVSYQASTINLAQRSSRNISLHNVPSTQSFHTSSQSSLIHMY